MTIRSLTIATRQSPLALWQAEHVRSLLLRHYPECTVTLLPMSTRGDQILDRSLAAIGGKGLFIKELEVAMQEGRADLAVHSLKDVPMQLPEGFALGSILAREDPRDAFVSSQHPSFAALPERAVVGTSSLRRAVQLRLSRPDLVIRELRGNVNTRLKKLDAGDYDAIILAAAGLDRLGFSSRIVERLDVSAFIPAVGQAALAVEIREADPTLLAMLAPLHCQQTAIAVAAERAFSLRLGGSCQTPIAAHCVASPQGWCMSALLATPSGGEILHGKYPAQHLDEVSAKTFGENAAADFYARGAERLLCEPSV